MADFILETANCICQCIAPTLQSAYDATVDPFINLEKNWESLTEERRKLQVDKDKLNTLVALNANQLKDPSSEVTHWKEMAAELSQSSITRTEYDELERCLCNCTPNLYFRLKLGKRVNEELDGVTKLLSQRITSPSRTLAYTQLPDNNVEDRIDEAFGLDALLCKLRDYCNDKNRNIIGIHGLGGVGKTTLLKEFYNELKTNSDYKVVLFVKVSNSEVLNVTDIQMQIYQRLSMHWNETESEHFRAEFLLQFLRKKKYVILMDDVRKDFKLKNVGIPKPTRRDDNCKIFLASRSQEVCIKMEAHKSMLKVICWEEKEAKCLFLENLTDEAKQAIEEDGDIKAHADAIVRSCGGLPLALNVIGRALALSMLSPIDRDEWRKVAATLKSTPVHVPCVEEDLFIPLEYSYDQLKHDIQQKCFLYCSLFPENGRINKEQLVQYWIGEGLINESKDGDYIIDKLVSASLLERGDESSEIKMHDIIRQFALWLPGHANRQESVFWVEAGRGLKEAPKVRQWEGATRISLMFNDISHLPESPKCANLTTLLLQNNPNLRVLPPDFFKNMPCLKVLDLSHTALEEFPISANVPASLQHLNLCHTRIAKLPKDVAKLKQLRYLNLSETHALKEIPDKTISVLTSLRVLSIYKSNYGVQKVQDLNLERLENLDYLGITIHSEQVLKKLQSTDRLAQSTGHLSLQHCVGMKSIRLSIFQHLVRLVVLFVHDCSDLKKLKFDDIEPILQVLTLASLPNLARISEGPEPRRHLHNLRSLTIETCPKLESITWILRLNSLEKLAISRCDGMESIVEVVIDDVGACMASTSTIPQGNEEEQSVQDREIQVWTDVQNETEEKTDGRTDAGLQRTRKAFGRLKSIVLTDLMKLERICDNMYFPCLETIIVVNCPNLRKLPLGCNSQKLKLKQIRGSRDWWNKLVWEEENLASVYGVHFVPV